MRGSQGGDAEIGDYRGKRADAALVIEQARFFLARETVTKQFQMITFLVGGAAAGNIEDSTG
jgi:hypothetical protein